MSSTETNQQVRWGLLSTARINRRLIPVIRMSPRGRVVAVASRQLESAQAYAAEWQIEQTFGSYEAMLASDSVDAVYISLPNHLHAEWTVAALEAGKHVLCEKPFALTLADVDRMTAAAEQTGMLLAEAFMYLYHPQTEALGHFIKSGRLGEISRVRADLEFTITVPNNVRLVPEYGGGALWDIGSYGVSFAQFVFGGRPTTLQAQQWVGTSSGVDEVFNAQMGYPGGGVAQISASFRNPPHARAEIAGTNGRLEIGNPFFPDASNMIFYPREAEAESLDFDHEPAHYSQVVNMNAAILDGAPLKLGLDQTRMHVETILALYDTLNKDGHN
jgi:predicted dehydrogenase